MKTMIKSKDFKEIANYRYDFFGEPFKMKIQGSKFKVQTLFGTIITVVMFFSLITYGGLKYKIMADYADTTVQVSEISYHYNYTQELATQMGFNVAFGLTDFDSGNQIVADPDYGIVIARRASWGPD